MLALSVEMTTKAVNAAKGVSAPTTPWTTVLISTPVCPERVFDIGEIISDNDQRGKYLKKVFSKKSKTKAMLKTLGCYGFYGLHDDPCRSTPQTKLRLTANCDQDRDAGVAFVLSDATAFAKETMPRETITPIKTLSKSFQKRMRKKAAKAAKTAKAAKAAKAAKTAKAAKAKAAKVAIANDAAIAQALQDLQADEVAVRKALYEKQYPPF